MIGTIKEIGTLFVSWGGQAYRRIYADLSVKPFVTLATLTILSSLVIGGGYLGVIIKDEVNKKDSTVILDTDN